MHYYRHRDGVAENQGLLLGFQPGQDAAQLAAARRSRQHGVNVPVIVQQAGQPGA